MTRFPKPLRAGDLIAVSITQAAVLPLSSQDLASVVISTDGR
jgi:acyl dehydratase